VSRTRYYLSTLLRTKEYIMKFLCAIRTNGHRVFINMEEIVALEYQATDNVQYTAVCLRNGREIDVTGTPEDLLQPPKVQTIEL
jgi:hypothetical protein